MLRRLPSMDSPRFSSDRTTSMRPSGHTDMMLSVNGFHVNTMDDRWMLNIVWWKPCWRKIITDIEGRKTTPVGVSCLRSFWGHKTSMWGCAISAERRCRLKSPKNGAKHGIIRSVPSVPPQSFRPGTNQAGRRHIAPWDFAVPWPGPLSVSGPSLRGYEWPRVTSETFCRLLISRWCLVFISRNFNEFCNSIPWVLSVIRKDFLQGMISFF